MKTKMIYSTGNLNNKNINTRRYDIDALRVIVFGLLIFYHVGMFFVPWDFHIKNNVIYQKLIYPMIFVNQWRLPLLFIISGMGTCYALSKRTGLQFIAERLKRLLIPLVTGILLIVPPQVYLERLDKGQFDGNYLDFWTTQAFTGVYPEGNFSWHHLWFLPYLLLFSLALTPVFLYLRKNPNTKFIQWLGKISALKFGLYVFAIPLLAWELFLKHRFPSTHALVGDWYNIAHYATLFLTGFILVNLKDNFWKSVEKYKQEFLITGCLAFATLMILWFGTGQFLGKNIIEATVQAANLWSWCLAGIGFAATYLNKKSKKLNYANQAVYPFYILHQTVLIIIGFYLKNVAWGGGTKFIIMVVGTFTISWIVYEFGIRRTPFIKTLFGLKN